jgi:precorrin-6B methylase 2
MKKKLYQVGFGLIENDIEHLNVDRLTVVAIDAEQAIKKAKKRKNYFIQYVSFVSEIDKV